MNFDGISSSRKSFIKLSSLIVTTVFINTSPVFSEERASENQDDKKTLENPNQANSQNQKKDADKISHKAEGVISLDVTVSNNKIYLLIGENIKGQTSLWLQISDNDGISWSHKLEIPIPTSSGATISRGSDARVAKVGKSLVVLWMSHVEGARFGSGPMVSMISHDEGRSWQASEDPADWKKGPHGFFSLTNSGDLLHATWLDKRDDHISVVGAQGLRYAFSQDKGKTWSRNLTLDDVACACCWTKSVSDKDGNLFVLYRDKQPSDMALGVVNSQHIWSRLSTVGSFNWDFSGCPHIGGGLAINQKGTKKELHAIIGTRKQENAGIFHLMSTNEGKNWSAPIKLGDTSSTHGDIATDRAGKIYAVWDMIDPEVQDGSTAIFLAYSTNGINWQDPIKLSGPRLSASHPRITPYRSGVVVFWTDKDDRGVSSLRFQRFSGVQSAVIKNRQ